MTARNRPSPTCIRLPADLLAWVEKRAKARGENRNYFIVRALQRLREVEEKTKGFE